jgi:hypothetical protein
VIRLSGATAIAFRRSFDAVVVDDAPLAEQAFASAEVLFRAVAQMVGFGLGRPKMLYFSMGVD